LDNGLILDTRFYSGKQIIINKNNYNLNLYNGDIGIMFLDSDNDYKVYFEIEDQIIGYKLSYLDYYDLSYAITVHKSQGSEFDHVAFILPEVDHPLLTRKLLYTAVTRAKQKLSIWGNRNVISCSIAKNAN
jgi:exodeoxyribonuclease V alpha subunit